MSGVSSSTAFTGSSSFSQQLSTIISRAVARASAPMQQLQIQQGAIASQQAELQILSNDFQSLQSSIDSINNAVALGAYTASVSDTSVLSASTSSGVRGGSYSITVTNTGAQTNTMSINGLTTVSDPSSGNIDSDSSYTLTVGSNSYQITTTGGSLNALADAINASGANVQATVVNVGSSSAPDYRLSVQSLQYAPDTIQLSDSSNTDLLNTISTGSYVQYQVNGQPATPIDSTTRTVTISPGLTLNLLKAGTATVSVSQSTAGLSTAVSSFVSAYNAVADELTKNRGQNGGPLAGESIVYQLQNVLRNLAQYAAPSGNLGALASLGISFDNTGHLQFDQATFGQTAPNDVLNFFGSEAGSGFLQAASNALTEVNDSTNGLLPQATQATISEISSIGAKISSDQDTVNQLQTSLTQQMSAADAAIASLEQQVSQITALFAAMQQESRNFTS